MADAPLYVIANWREHFEHPDHKREAVKRMHWVKMSNKLHGDGYVWLVEHKDGAAHFGVWVALVELASQCKPRGELRQDFGPPHTVHTLSLKTRLPERVIAQALTRLVVPGWVEVQHCASTVQAEIPPTGQDRTGQDKTEHNTTMARDARRRAPDPSAMEVADYLREAILSHSADHACARNGAAEKWAKDIDRAIRIDGRDPGELRGAIDFAHRREEEHFWRPNIQSGKKLREKFDVLKAQAARAAGGRANPQTAGAVRRFADGEE